MPTGSHARECNGKYILGREYKFYAIIPQGQRSNEGMTLQVVDLEVYMTGKRKRMICSIYLPPTDLVMEEGLRDLLEQLPVPMILLRDFKAHDLLWGSEKMSTKGKILEKILHRFNLLCLNEKTY